MRKHMKPLLTVVASAVIAVAVDRCVMRSEAPVTVVEAAAIEVIPRVTLGDVAYVLPKLIECEQGPFSDPELSLDPPSHASIRQLVHAKREFFLHDASLIDEEYDRRISVRFANRAKYPSRSLQEEFDRESLTLHKLTDISAPSLSWIKQREDEIWGRLVRDWLAGSNYR